MFRDEHYIWTTDHGCGRYALTADAKTLKKRFNVKAARTPVINPNYNTAPTQRMPVVIRRKDTNELSVMKWGLTPVWAAKIPNWEGKSFNARAETLEEKNTWRVPFERTRCLVPFNAFYEWKGKGQPYLFEVGDKELRAFAGLYTEWVDKVTGEINASYTIITSTPDKTMEPYHNRMPVILERDEEQTWIDPGETDFVKLKALLNPYGKKDLTMYPVSPKMGDTANNFEELIERRAA